MGTHFKQLVMSNLNTIQSINGTANVSITGTKVDGTAFANREFTLNSSDQKVEDVVVLQESNGAYKSLRVSNISTISVL